MKILVTGATGFIGNYVIEELLKNNCHVIASSTDVEKARGNTWFKEVDYLPLDLKKIQPGFNYLSYFKYPDAVIHLAWEGLPNYSMAFHVEENLPRHLAFLNNLIDNGLSDLTVSGTCFEYGIQEGCLQEELESRPANSYARAKDHLRIALEERRKKKNFHLKWLRLFYMYGRGQGPNSLFSQLDRALARGDQVFNMSGGDQVRDYLPVGKMAQYIVKIALQNTINGIINICSGEPIKVKQLVLNYLDENHSNIQLNLNYYPYSVYEPMNFWGDNSKLRSINNQ